MKRSNIRTSLLSREVHLRPFPMVWSEHFNGLVGKFSGKESQILKYRFPLSTRLPQNQFLGAIQTGLAFLPVSRKKHTVSATPKEKKPACLAVPKSINFTARPSQPEALPTKKQLWNPSQIWWIADSAPGAAGDCLASHRNARFAPRRGDIWPASYGYAGQRWTNLSTKRNTIWRLGRTF